MDQAGEGGGTCERVKFFDRGRELSTKASLLRPLTEKRVVLLKQVRETPASITMLAQKLKRDRSAVTRDIQMLESFGIVQVTERPLPGHGRQKWVTPLAQEIQLTAWL